jgi:adenine-specific DNA-methyltransferase
MRCLLMATDPGDLVLDPTCGSGTTATVAEQWGRRWITIDTSRVALALARARIMGARYPFYLLADSREGQLKEAEVTRSAPSTQPVQGNLRHGFVYERVPHITLKSIANNAEIDVIWEQWQAKLEPLREIAECRAQQDLAGMGDPARRRPRLARHREEAARRLVAGAHRPAEGNRRLDRRQGRVRNPLRQALPEHEVRPRRRSLHRRKPLAAPHARRRRGRRADRRFPGRPRRVRARQSFPQLILENLKTAGVQQAHKEDRITFTALTPWPGEGAICAEGRYLEGQEGEMREKRAGIFIGPEFGTVQRSDLVEAARECGEAGFDALIACAFNYEAHATEFSKLGRIPVLKARMNADLHMAADLKNTGKGNLFVIFGEPDISLLPQDDGKLCIKVNGVDVFKPQTGEVISDSTDGIACWFIDTDYNQESFFVRHAYFLGANDPYSALKTTLKAEIDPKPGPA